MEMSDRRQELIERKLRTFKHLPPAYEQCFRFVQEVYGQRWFQTFPIPEIVHSLYAL